MWIHGIKQWDDKFASTKMVKSLIACFVICILGAPIVLLSDNFGTWTVTLVLFGVHLVVIVWGIPYLFRLAVNTRRENKIRKLKLENDRIKLQLWIKEQDEKCSGTEFLELFMSLSTLEYQAKLVESVSKNNSLKSNQESVQAIKDAIQYIETNTDATYLIDNLFILLERIQSEKE